MIVNTTGEIIQNGGSTLPDVTDADNGKILKVVGGEWNKASGASVELIVGNMQASFTTSTPSYVLPNSALGAWNDLPEGKHFADYDEIMLVVIFQQSPSDAQPQSYATMSVPTWMLDTGNNLNDYGVNMYVMPNNRGAQVAIRKDDKYNVENYNYGSPIALLGIKH